MARGFRRDADEDLQHDGNRLERGACVDRPVDGEYRLLHRAAAWSERQSVPVGFPGCIRCGAVRVPRLGRTDLVG